MVDMVQANPRGPIEPTRNVRLPVIGTLTATVRTFWRAPWKLVGMLFLPFPFQILSGIGQFLVTRPGGSPDAITITVFVVVGLLQYVVLIVVLGALYAAGSRIIERGRFSFGEVIGVGVRRFFPFLGAGILLALGISLGLVLLIIPGIILSLMWAVALPACVIESLGPIQCLGRSRFLTRDNRWRILGSYVLVGLLPIVVVYALGLILIATKILALQIIGGLILVIGGISVGTMLGTFPAVIFHQLRAIKEGGAPGGVSRVFD